MHIKKLLVISVGEITLICMCFLKKCLSNPRFYCQQPPLKRNLSIQSLPSQFTGILSIRNQRLVPCYKTVTVTVVFIESQYHRMAWVEKDRNDHWVSTPHYVCRVTNHQTRLPRATSSLDFCLFVSNHYTTNHSTVLRMSASYKFLVQNKLKLWNIHQM